MEQISIGSKIKDLRNKNQLTQTQLALLVGVSNKAVSKWENDEGYPDIQNLKRLAEVFNTTVDYLISDQKKTNENIFNLKSFLIVLLILVTFGLMFAKYMPVYVPYNEMRYAFAEKEYLSYLSGYLMIKNLFQYGVMDDYGISIGMLMYVILNISILFLLLRGKLKGLERFRLIFVGTSLLQIYCYIASLFYINNSIQSYGEMYKRIKTFPSPFDYVDVTAYIFVFIQLIILIIMYFDTIVDILKLRNHKVISKLIVKISQH